MELMAFPSRPSFLFHENLPAVAAGDVYSGFQLSILYVIDVSGFLSCQVIDETIGAFRLVDGNFLYSCLRPLVFGHEGEGDVAVLVFLYVVNRLSHEFRAVGKLVV